MNRYGRTAMEHWSRHRSQDLAQISDPEAYFTTLGEEIEQQVLTLSQDLAGPDPVGENYLTKIGRLNAARSRAEESVLAELVWPQEPTQDPSEDEDATPSRTDLFQQRVAEALQG